MAARVSEEELIDAVVRAHGTYVTYVEIKAVAKANGWLVPKSVWSRYDKDLKKIVLGKNGSPVATTPLRDVSQLFKDLEDLVTIVADGHRPSLLITGGPGTGKTHTVLSTLAGLGMTKGHEYVVIKGKTTAYGVYRTLFMNRNKIVVYDDSDDVFSGVDTRNLLKAALDSYDQRVLSWQSKLMVDVQGSDEEKESRYLEIEERLLSGQDAMLPSEFLFAGQIIFISNLPSNKIEPAIISRSLTIEVDLSADEMFDRIETVMDTIHPPQSIMSIEYKREVLDHLRDNHAANPRKKVTMRDFIGGMMIRSSGNPRWKELLRYS